MRLLLDNNLPPGLIPLLEAAGHDVTHVRDLGLAAAPHHQVLTRARDEQRVLVSADTDFGTLLARTGDSAPSVILLRQTQGRRAAQVAGLLSANLPQLETRRRRGRRHPRRQPADTTPALRSRTLITAREPPRIHSHAAVRAVVPMVVRRLATPA